MGRISWGVYAFNMLVAHAGWGIVKNKSKSTVQ